MRKALQRMVAAALAVAGTSTAVFAAPGAREDNSSLAVWVFLGFCALIVVAQLVPAIRSARMAARAAREAKEEASAVGTAAEK
jgi:hypothetical protein